MGPSSADAQNSLLVSVLVERHAGEAKLYKIRKMHEIKIKLKNMPNYISGLISHESNWELEESAIPVQILTRGVR